MQRLNSPEQKDYKHKINPLLDRQIDQITEGIPKNFNKSLRMLSEGHIKTIISYITTLNTEIHLSTNYKKDIIQLLTKFSKVHADNINKYNFDFKEVARSDVINFLDSLRKTDTKDPYHKWIGTYNVYKVHLIRFFKWLNAPNTPSAQRSKPAVVENIPNLKRKEISHYKPSDLWTPEDDLLFLKYCPSLREKCYHAISRDLAARPHEILNLKIRDIVYKNVNGRVYVEVTVNGKTGTRPLVLINSIPYLKDYMDHSHPMPNNPNAPLICGIGKGLGKHLLSTSLFKTYEKYKQKVFPKLLDNPNIAPEDKQKIKDLLKKPWNPYIRRHSSLTEKSMYLKEGVLRQYSGWSQKSQMHLRYVHYFGNEPTKNILQEYGLIDKSTQLDPLKSKICTNCSNANKPDAKFCTRCRMVLSYDAYNETLEIQKEKEDRLITIENQFNAMQSQIQSVLSSLSNIRDQNQVNQMAKTLYNSKILKKED
jgi:integrase